MSLLLFPNTFQGQPKICGKSMLEKVVGVLILHTFSCLGTINSCYFTSNFTRGKKILLEAKVWLPSILLIAFIGIWAVLGKEEGSCLNLLTGSNVTNEREISTRRTLYSKISSSTAVYCCALCTRTDFLRDTHFLLWIDMNTSRHVRFTQTSMRRW